MFDSLFLDNPASYFESIHFMKEEEKQNIEFFYQHSASFLSSRFSLAY